MTTQLNREIKAFCPDFGPIRDILLSHGASYVEKKDQVDYYYNLPDPVMQDGTRRLKVRLEDDDAQVVYYVEGEESGARTSRFQVWGLNSVQTKEMLDAALGVKAVVRKERELWVKDNVRFNLDQVEAIGQVLEVEILSQEGLDIEAQLEEYRNLFEPHLDEHIVGSNEDLVGLP